MLFKEFKVVNKETIHFMKSSTDKPSKKKKKNKKTEKEVVGVITIAHPPHYQLPLVIRDPIPPITVLGPPAMIPLSSRDKGVDVPISDDSESDFE